ncbi:hypothetical protein [Kribbella sp. NPDC049584]|uniref:hypothetical protein n=1 Tax=Kribbella sp. NPDC049584 TaxID=3154833 RepID=UPI0034419A73
MPEALFAETVILVERDEDAAVLQSLGACTNELALAGICVALCRLVGATEQDFPVDDVSPTLVFIPDILETLLVSDLPE